MIVHEPLPREVARHPSLQLLLDDTVPAVLAAHGPTETFLGQETECPGPPRTFPLECADRSARWHWATCRRTPKRLPVRCGREGRAFHRIPSRICPAPDRHMEVPSARRSGKPSLIVNPRPSKSGRPSLIVKTWLSSFGRSSLINASWLFQNWKAVDKGKNFHPQNWQAMENRFSSHRPKWKAVKNPVNTTFGRSAAVSAEDQPQHWKKQEAG